MADIVDQANDLADTWLQQALARRPTESRASAAECEDCGEPIPEPRRQAVPGVQTCVTCATAREGRR